MNRSEPPKPSLNILDRSSKDKSQINILGSSQSQNFRVQEDSVRGNIFQLPAPWISTSIFQKLLICTLISVKESAVCCTLFWVLDGSGNDQKHNSDGFKQKCIAPCKGQGCLASGEAGSTCSVSLGIHLFLCISELNFFISFILIKLLL